MVLLGMNVYGTEDDLADIKRLQAREAWASRDASVILLAVDRAWVDENSSLFADVFVTNGSQSAIRLPRGTVCKGHWGSQVDPIEHTLALSDDSLEALYEAIHEYKRIVRQRTELLPSECATLELFRHRRETILAEEDIETIAPGRTALLRAVYLGQFVPDTRDREHPVRSFEVIYRHSSQVVILSGKLALDEAAGAEEIERQRSLYDGVLKGRGQFLIR